MAPIRLGTVGSGGMASRRLENFAGLANCKLVALAARNPQTGSALAQRHGTDLHADWREMVARDDLDAVLVFTHNQLHGPIALAALEAGKHVFAEYPLARHLHEGEKLVEQASNSSLVLRLAHNEPISPEHQQLKREISALGPLHLATFTRLTPGRGSRPEVLFNLDLSGPPALFFIYHVYPLVDLFGPAQWVESHAEYVGLDSDGSYERFINTVTVQFTHSGLAQWTWAGGVAIHEAEEYERLVLQKGTMLYRDGCYHRSNAEALHKMQVQERRKHSLESLFLEEVRGESAGWREDLPVAYEATRIGLAAEESVRKDRRIDLN